MSKALGQNSIIEVTEEALRQLLLMGNIFESNKKAQLSNVLQQIEMGNKQLYKQFASIILDYIRNFQTQKRIKQLMFDHITQLAISANPIIINDINNDIFTTIPNYYEKKEQLDDYIILWKHIYNGKKDKQDFPNVAKTLEQIETPSSTKLSGKFAKYLSEFVKNLQKAHEKKVQFFQDFEDSSFSESITDESRITDIIYMDIMELKAIRKRVQSLPLSEQNCAEYLIKMKTFLNLRSNSLSGQLLTQFNKQKIWAKHFIDHHQDYLKKGQNTSLPSLNKSNQLLISLSKDEESIDQPLANFYKNKTKLPSGVSPKSQFGDQPENNSKNKNTGSQLKNFTINQVPIDESRYTDRSSKNNIPVFNNSLNLGYAQDQVIERNSKLFQQNKNKDNVSNNFYQKMSFQPNQNRQNAAKIVPLQKPKAQDTLPLEESTLNNMSIPQQVMSPMLKNFQKQVQQFPSNQNLRNDVMGNTVYSKQGSNNPFANSKTNYNPVSNTKSPYEQYKQVKHPIDVHSPIRNRMTENDLDSENLEENIVIKPHYQNYAFSPAQKRSSNAQDLKIQDYAQTEYNFYRSGNDKSNTNNFLSKQKLFSQQLSPRSHGFNQSRGKKRLSQLTSEKKQRKVNVPKEQILIGPEEYVFRPYAIHFKGNSSNFNSFKRNCMEDKFSLYVSTQLVISCSLRKLKDNKVEIQLLYDNQCRNELQINVLYKIPKSFKIQKVSKIHKKFKLKNMEKHVFNLTVLEFPLEMCLLQLSYCALDQQDEGIDNLYIPIPITIKNFIETLVTNRVQWLKTYKKLIGQSQIQPFILSRTFELNRSVIDPAQIDVVLNREFLNVGSIEGYSVEQFGCICHYKSINHLMFLVRISIRVDHIVTIEIITEDETTDNQRDFMKYYLELLVTLLGKYST